MIAKSIAAETAELASVLPISQTAFIPSSAALDDLVRLLRETVLLLAFATIFRASSEALFIVLFAALRAIVWLLTLIPLSLTLSDNLVNSLLYARTASISESESIFCLLKNSLKFPVSSLILPCFVSIVLNIELYSKNVNVGNKMFNS